MCKSNVSSSSLSCDDEIVKQITNLRSDTLINHKPSAASEKDIMY